jgi:hypothetical protein
MSLERRLTEALHRTDDFQPSVDLFARLNRSIQEDGAHRRRLAMGGAVVAAGLGGVAILLNAVSTRDPDGVLMLPKWSMQIVVFTVLSMCLLGFGPAIRRLGQPYLADVFHISPATGERFSRLLDIAYYLFFGGGILTFLDVTEIGSFVPAGESLTSVARQVALFLTTLGLAHVGNLLLFPIVGLLFSSLTRRGLRRSAGAEAPPISPRVQRTERIVTAIVFAVVLLAIGGGLLVIAVAVFGVVQW